MLKAAILLNCLRARNHVSVDHAFISDICTTESHLKGQRSGFKCYLCDVETSDLRQLSVHAHLSNRNDYDNYFVQWLGGLSEIEGDPKLSMLV